MDESRTPVEHQARAGNHDQAGVAEPVAPAYVGTFQWTDAHGRDGSVDIHAAAQADPPVLARTTDDAAAVIAEVDSDGRPAWSAPRMAAAGLDTAAARNDLIEVIHQTYLALPECGTGR